MVGWGAGGGSFTYTGSYSGLSEAYKNGFAIICSFFIFHLSKEFRAGQDILENRVIGIVPRIVMVDIILNDNPIIYKWILFLVRAAGLPIRRGGCIRDGLVEKHIYVLLFACFINV